LDGETQTALGGKVALSGGVMTGPLTATALTSNGQIESKATGFKFPDGTVQASAASIPPGAVMDFAMNSAPTGWLSCDGAAVNRTTYAALFAAIGTTWGAGDGTTTFQLPDMRGYFRRGAGTNSDGTASGAFATKVEDTFQAHWHDVFDQNGNEARSSNTVGTISNQYVLGTANSGFRLSARTLKDGGGGTPRSSSETRPSNIAVLTCIKT
jgi:microcystin-dependent protein